jgi:hypothetical protein
MESKKIRWVYAAGAAVACAGVLVAANVAFAKTQSPQDVSAGAALGLAVSASSEAPTPPPTPTASTSPADESQKPEGTVVDTGIKAKDGTWVLYAVPVSVKELKSTHFGLMLGRRLPDGSVSADVVTNETSGSDKAKGFHAGQGGMNVNGEDTLTFGYYVGAATKITGQAHGKSVVAKQATWSKDRSVVFYWFAPKTTVSGLKAYGSNGRALTSGNSSIGVG